MALFVIPRRSRGTCCWWEDALLALEKASQLFASRRMPQLPQRLRFDLPNALTGHVELLAHLFERVVGIHFDAEAHAQHFRFARRQRIENVLADVAQARVDRGFG